MFASFVDSTRFRYNSFHVREPSVNGIRFFVSLSLNDRRKPCLTNEPGLLFLLMLKDPAKMQEERKRRRRRGKKGRKDKQEKCSFAIFIRKFQIEWFDFKFLRTNSALLDDHRNRTKRVKVVAEQVGWKTIIEARKNRSS